MWHTLTLLVALSSIVSATVRGPACCSRELNNCKSQGAWGCVRIPAGNGLSGPNCVDQTRGCDGACGVFGRVVYAYRKHNSKDRQCVCSFDDASKLAPTCPRPPPPPLRPIRGGQCCFQGTDYCKALGAAGCVTAGNQAFCVRQTPNCNQACGGSGFAYQKAGSSDRRCVCTGFADASQPNPQCPRPRPPPPPPPSVQPIRGSQCCDDGLQTCKGQGAWGCVQADATYCIDQTQNCDQACGGGGFAYQKRNSDDRRCVCSNEDLAKTNPSCPAPPPPPPPPPPGPPIRGGQCCSNFVNQCHGEGAWGCIQADAAYCVDQTKNCDSICGGSGFAYQKRNSGDATCVCSDEDANQAGSC